MSSKDRSVVIYGSMHIRRCLDSLVTEPKVKSSFERIASGRLPQLPENGYKDIAS